MCIYIQRSEAGKGGDVKRFQNKKRGRSKKWRGLNSPFKNLVNKSRRSYRSRGNERERSLQVLRFGLIVRVGNG